MSRVFTNDAFCGEEDEDEKEEKKKQYTHLWTVLGIHPVIVVVVVTAVFVTHVWKRNGDTIK